MASSTSPPARADVRTALSPENLALVASVARTGSMAGAARELGLVPSALTYRVRQLEDALDVLLFDRSSRQAKLTAAGCELLRSGEHLLNELDSVAERVKRVATGWEMQFSLVADNLISRRTLFELCEAFFALQAPTRLRLRAETLSGTVESLLSGHSDLAIGVVMAEGDTPAGLQVEPLGAVTFVFAVAPHHPLAQATEPLTDETIALHRAVAVADSTRRGNGLTFGLLSGQPVFTVPTMQHKLEAQLRGMGCGFLPEPLALPYLQAGHLVAPPVQRGKRVVTVHYAWKRPPGQDRRTQTQAPQGRAMAWWLSQLQHPTTRSALLQGV